MRKLKLQIQISVDGFAASSNGEMDWMVWNWDDALKKHVTELTESVDTVVMGKNIAQGMAGYWPAVEANPDSSKEDLYIAKKMNHLPKIVFSNSITSLDWTNVRIVNDDITVVMSDLKSQPGKDMIMYGGTSIVSSFINLNLIDEYHLFVNPALLGGGIPLFQTTNERLNLKLVTAIPTACGIVILHYQPVK